MERNCDKCVYHSSGSCSVFECKGTKTIDDIRADALAEKKYIIKEDGSIHSLDEDIENAYNRGRADAIAELQEQIPKWHKVELRPLTEEEKEEYGDDFEFIYDCEFPDDGQEVLVATKWGVDKTTFYIDCGSYFENYEDEGEVIAWMELPKFDEVE